MTVSGRVAGIVAGYVQGEIFKLSELPVLSSEAHPLHPVAMAASTSSAPQRSLIVPVPVTSGLVMLATQTCDLQASRTERGQILALVAPVVALEGDDLTNARRDMRPNFVAIPWLNQESFADMDQLSAVDRGLLAVADSVARPSSEPERRDLASRLGRYFQRPALPDEVSQALKPLQKIATHSGTSMTKVLEAIEEFRVRAKPGYDSPSPWELNLMLIVSVDWLSDIEPVPVSAHSDHFEGLASEMVALYQSGSSPGELAFLWGRFGVMMRNKLLKNLPKDGPVSGIRVSTQFALTPSEYATSDTLDFGHVSFEK